MSFTVVFINNRLYEKAKKLIFFRVANKTQFPALAKLLQKSDWSRVSPMQFGMQTECFFANKLYTCKCSMWIKVLAAKWVFQSAAKIHRNWHE
jgi:hypothetical protein